MKILNRLHFFKTNFVLNPKRTINRTSKEKIRYWIQILFIKFGLWCGFQNIEYSYVHGDKKRLIIGNGCSTTNTIFNVVSGKIIIGDNTFFGHSCMVLTGTHKYYKGIRGGLHDPPIEETPSDGRDIIIGSGCFIGSGVIIVGCVEIGNNTVIGAGAVVTKNIPSGCFAAGVPAQVILTQNELE